MNEEYKPSNVDEALAVFSQKSDYSLKTQDLKMYDDAVVEAKKQLFTLLMSKKPEERDTNNSMTNEIYNLGFNQALKEWEDVIKGVFGV